MKVKCVHHAEEVYELIKDRARHDYIYQFNNLEPKLWENVVCFGLYSGTGLKEIAMLNMNYRVPVLLAACYDNVELNIELISGIKKYLPPEFYTHMDHTTLITVFSKSEIHGKEDYMNMGLCDQTAMAGRPTGEAVRLGWKDLQDIKELLEASYPDAWLDDELVKLGENFGIYADSKLISFAGIHAFSRKYQVAAVAHVTTHPDHRKKGHGEAVVAELLKDLKDKIGYIGLNVRANNQPAISCYKKLGFKAFGSFAACEIKR